MFSSNFQDKKPERKQVLIKKNFKIMANLDYGGISALWLWLFTTKPFLNRNALLHLYYAIFHSHLTYGLITWGLTFKTHLNKLITLQNKAVKIIGGGNYYDKNHSLLLKILKLPDLIKLEMALFVHKVRIKAVPFNSPNISPK